MLICSGVAIRTVAVDCFVVPPRKDEWGEWWWMLVDFMDCMDYMDDVDVLR